jgi:uncharacterized protein (TIGR02588 family)
VTRRGSRKHEAPLAEWIVGGLGATILVGTIVTLLWGAVSSGRLPPDLAPRVERVWTLAHGHVVEISVRNDGDQAAASVTLAGELRLGDGGVERRAITLDYVPARSEGAGGLVFDADPAEGELRLSVEGWSEP